MSTSIRKNFTYRSILTVSTYIVSLITFPYVTRVLGVENIGLVNFVDNTINYFILFATMGISILGVREISSVNSDVEKRNKAFANILGLNLLFTFVVTLLFIVCLTIIPLFRQYEDLFYIGIAKIIFTAFLVEWFFTGIEEFQYITVRSIIIKLVYVGSVFCFIKDSDDYKLYFILTTAVVVLNSVVNMLYIQQFVKIRVQELLSFHYLKANLSLGIYLLLNSMYSTFNVIFLGFVSDNVQVGLYTTAFKLYSIILAFFSAFTTVMLPRVNAILTQNDKDNFVKLINKSLSIIYTFSIPLIIFSMMMASNIISLLAGKEYGDAVIPMIIIMPTVLVVGISQILAVQIITPLRKDKVLLIASIMGAISGISMNVLLVPQFQSIGTAITLFSSETIVASVYIYYVTRKRIVNLCLPLLLENIMCCLPSAAICYLVNVLISNRLISMFVAFAVGGIIWALLCYRIPNNCLKLVLRK